MIHVFKTNVLNQETIHLIGTKLDALTNNAKWNFDLDDCDKILRVDSDQISADQVINLLRSNDIACEEL